MFNLNNIKEAFFAALLVIIFTIPVSFIVIKYDLLRSVKKDIRGLDIYDLYFGEKNNNSNARDTNIVIVQIENDRDKIAEQINTIEKYDLEKQNIKLLLRQIISMLIHIKSIGGDRIGYHNNWLY